jgi:hypothetical protein
MGVAGSDQDSGSEHPGRPSRDVAGAGNSLSVGDFPRVSIGMLHCSPFGGSRITSCSRRYYRAVPDPERYRCSNNSAKIDRFKKVVLKVL